MIRDEAISGNALLVFLALASHTGRGGVHPSQRTLRKEARLSENPVRVALAELEAAGVVERVRRTDAAGHRKSDAYLLLVNGPLGPGEALDADSEPRGDAQHSDAEAPTLTDSGLVPLIEEEPIKNPSDVFEEFWKVYPRHVAKTAARTKFLAIAKTVDVDLVLAGARRFAEDPNLPETKYIPHPTTWLNGGRWDDDPLPARDGDEPPKDYGVEEWMLR
jgi:hypothetical protein